MRQSVAGKFLGLEHAPSPTNTLRQLTTFSRARWPSLLHTFTISAFLPASLILIRSSSHVCMCSLTSEPEVLVSTGASDNITTHPPQLPASIFSPPPYPSSTGRRQDSPPPPAQLLLQGLGTFPTSTCVPYLPSIVTLRVQSNLPNC